MFGMARVRVIPAAAAAASLALTISACSTSSGPSTHKGSAGSGGLKGMTIDYVGYGKPNPWAVAFNQVYLDAVKSSGVTVRDLSTLDAGTQVQNINQAIAQKPNLIVIAALDPKTLVVPIQKAKAAGIPVLAYDATVDPSVAADVMGVYSNSEQLGELAAQNLIEGLKAQGRTSGNIIALTGFASQLVTIDRLAGFKKVLATAPQYKLVAVEDAGWDPVKSGQIASQLLAKYGRDGVAGAYGMADYMAVPIITAAQQLGYPVGGKSGLVVTGGNCFKVGVQAIKAGTMYGTATEDPVTIAKQTAQYTVDFLAGKDQPKTVTIDEKRVTADNVATYATQCSQA